MSNDNENTPLEQSLRELEGPPPTAWELYGTKSGVTFSGEGSATPGSVDNVLHIKSTNGKKAILVAGITQSNITAGGLTYYALPFLILIPDLQLDAVSGKVDLPAPLPASLIPGTMVFMQCFAESNTNNYSKWSEGLKLTVQ